MVFWENLKRLVCLLPTSYISVCSGFAHHMTHTLKSDVSLVNRCLKSKYQNRTSALYLENNSVCSSLLAEVTVDTRYSIGVLIWYRLCRAQLLWCDCCVRSQFGQYFAHFSAFGFIASHNTRITSLFMKAA
jgi:hypothetical protein